MLARQRRRARARFHNRTQSIRAQAAPSNAMTSFALTTAGITPTITSTADINQHQVGGRRQLGPGLAVEHPNVAIPTNGAATASSGLGVPVSGHLRTDGSRTAAFLGDTGSRLHSGMYQNRVDRNRLVRGPSEIPPRDCRRAATPQNRAWPFRSRSRQRYTKIAALVSGDRPGAHRRSPRK